MKRAEREHTEKPVMVFTGLELVDENMAAGCTMMINRTLREVLGKYEEPIDFHDRWIALFASTCGGVCHIPAATIFYRQHGDNRVGAAQLLKVKGKLRIKRILRFLQQQFSYFTKLLGY